MIPAVVEARVAGARLLRIHVGEERRRDPVVSRILRLAADAGIVVRFEDRRFFGRFSHRAHQQVIAVGEPFVYASLAEIVQRAGAYPPGLGWWSSII